MECDLPFWIFFLEFSSFWVPLGSTTKTQFCSRKMAWESELCSDFCVKVHECIEFEQKLNNKYLSALKCGHRILFRYPWLASQWARQTKPTSTITLFYGPINNIFGWYDIASQWPYFATTETFIGNYRSATAKSVSTDHNFLTKSKP